MPLTPECFQRLMAAARAGCPEAHVELIARYEPHLLRAIRRILKGWPRVRSKLDAEDVLQMTWTEFFTTMRGLEFAGPLCLLVFLVRMARNQLRFQWRRLATRRRSGDLRALSLHACSVDRRDPQPTPLETAAIAEILDRVLDARPAIQRRIVYFHLAGKSRDEIARAAGLGERQVRRILAEILADLLELLGLPEQQRPH
jgi:RNA polymerase sigma factor (sigma-70 family)